MQIFMDFINFFPLFGKPKINFFLAFYVTRGAISRMTKKLIQKGLVESYQKSENKKEIVQIQLYLALETLYANFHGFYKFLSLVR
jgi:hypothetical protein